MFTQEAFDFANTSINNWNSVSTGLFNAERSPLEALDLQCCSRSLWGSSDSSLVAAFEESLAIERQIEQFDPLLNDIQSSTGTIQGTKWNDLNGNGVKDAGEPGLAGWTIYLDENNNDALDPSEKSTTTDANGNYSFTGLEAGTYTVAEVSQPGWQQTFPKALSNGSFEAGNFTGWNTSGSTNVQTAVSGINPTQGTYQAVISNGGSSVTDTNLESFLGLSTGALDGLGNGNATQGSAIKLTPITVTAGTTLTFDWNFLSQESTPSSFNDFAFVSIKGVTELADTNSSFVTPVGSVKQTGYKTFSYTFTTAGTYTIGLGVVDVGDTTIDSTLLIDNFSLSNVSHTVNLTAGQTASNINFGNKATSALIFTEPNDTISSAINTGLSWTSASTFKNVGAIGDNPNVAAGVDVDFLKFALNAGDKLEIDIDTNQLASSLDSIVQLFDAQGNLITVNDNAAAPGETSSLDAYLQFTATTSGTYYVAVSGKGNSSYDPFVQGSGSVGSTGSYNLEVSLTPKFSSNYGYGLVDAAAAVATALGRSNPFPDVTNLGGNNWGLDMVKAPEVWNQGYTGQGIVVAVIDTGVDYNHPDLDANIWVNSGEIADNGIDDDSNGFVDDIRGWDFVDNDNNPMDSGSHGTHVAGTIAAEKNDFGVTGVAYNAKIMPIRVIGSQTWDEYHQDLANGIRYAADNGADVINLSLRTLGEVSAVKDAVEYAHQKGVVVVMAAGNDSASQPLFPANLANQWGVAVGAVDSTNKMASFSHRAGTTILDYVVAPGVNVYSTTPNNTYGYKSGTSMATPHVAGVAALILSANPNLTAAEVEDILTETANPQGITV